ncbi:RNA-binding protein [Legionella clemsonensis]|uniref:Uncharacterized protein n=1 Tax=Legionella clemsonensis TaxID=1867846 RepID=A0A222P1A6_9GAMM|nr:hypothetical protein [Legionella clemsonensis]ASQ45632.1 hypothetical protein clem_05380 [Legionella clemsonensis]
MSSHDLLKEIETLIKSYDWTEEVRFNWLRNFGKTLVFFQNPDYALEFDALNQAESLYPRGILAINGLLNRNCANEIKIAGIKKILRDKGYDGEDEEKSWLRTDNTHTVYGQLARMIANYEKNESCYIPIKL